MSDETYGVPTQEQLEKINKLAKRNLSEADVFVFPSKLAGDLIITDRYVQLQKELLDIFAVNAQKGVSCLIDHSWHSDGVWGVGGRPKAAIPYGRTFSASFGSGTEEGETISLNADTYMRRGIEIDGINTDDLIASIESGTIFDTSIGFNFQRAICSICGNNIYDYDECSHYPGETYEVEEEGKTVEKLCYIKAYPPGALWENSLVFDGAYDGAGVLSTSAGDILENVHGIYEVFTDFKNIDPSKPVIATYSPRVGLLTMVKKANHKKKYSVSGLLEQAKASVTSRDSIFAIGEKLGISKGQVENIAKLVLKGDEKGMKLSEKAVKMLGVFGMEVTDDFKPSEDTATMLEGLAEKWDSTVQSIKESVAPAKVDAFMTKEQTVEKLGKELSADEVLRYAKEGQEYHRKVVEEAIAMGVRAMGSDFPAETWKNTFATMGTGSILDTMKTWEAIATAAIPAGRQSDPDNGAGKPAIKLPDEAYSMKRK